MAHPEVDALDDGPGGAVDMSELRAAKEMPAAEALEILRRGELLHDVRVKRLRLKGEFTLPVRMRGVLLYQPEFQDATFQAEVSLNHCSVDRPRFRGEIVFAKGLDLRESVLIKAQLLNLTIKGPATWDFLHTRGKFLVTNCRFESSVRLWEARFKGWVDFRKCTFSGLADFRSLHAEEGFTFDACTFAGEAWFRGASIAKKFDAGASRFERLVDFSKAKLHDYVYLESIQPADQQCFAFLNTLGEKILITTDQLTGRLASEKNRDHKSAMHEYGFLKRAFEAMHRYEQEDWAFYRFKVNERQSMPRSWLRPISKLSQFCSWLFLDLGCSYGTSPRRAVRAALVIMLGFGLIYAAGMPDFGVDKPPLGPPLDSVGNRLILGIMTSVAVFTSGLGSLKDLAQGWMMLPLIVEALLGTLLWGLFIVAFSRKVIR